MQGLRIAVACVVGAALLAVTMWVFTRMAEAPQAPQAAEAVPDFYTSGHGWHSRTTNVMPPPAGTRYAASTW